ncbi:1035_t:CDS:2 [Funneliformis caledonium]|uniref:1035_t:CDS:1 n=1 Tax=Funneliformis caledonium TaxID=1117310 RepID=A0A9N9CI38_9GLOM|nr:1035_t:CDS:2 [Funneliformis caledonium]
MEEIIDVFEEKEEGEWAEENISERKLNLNQPFRTNKMLEKNKEEEGVLISAILDPRIKCLGFVDEEIHNKTKDLLKSKYD